MIVVEDGKVKNEEYYKILCEQVELLGGKMEWIQTAHVVCNLDLQQSVESYTNLLQTRFQLNPDKFNQSTWKTSGNAKIMGDYLKFFDSRFTDFKMRHLSSSQVSHISFHFIFHFSFFFIFD